MTDAVECCRCHQVVPQSWCDVFGWDFKADSTVWICKDGCRRSRGVVDLGLSQHTRWMLG